MNIGVFLLIAGFAAGFGELFVLIWFRSGEIKRWQFFSEILAGISTLFLAVALILLMRYFLIDDFSIKYVVEHSQADSPTLLKISGVWTGQQGSLLLWAALSGFFTFIYKVGSKTPEHPSVVQRTYAILTGINLAFILLVLLDSPFKTQRVVIDGYGLNTLLRTNWNVIHPFIIFVGYAATTVPFGIGLSRLFSRDPLERNQKDQLDFHMGLAWLTISLGIILGGYWAYITLGWGGYWAWDPVETASLVPWIICTAYYHTRPLFRSDSRVPGLVAVLSFLTVLYATYITRGGALQSVHAFPETPVTQVLVILILGISIVILVSLVLHPPKLTFNTDRFTAMSLYNKSMVLSFLSLSILAFVSFLGIFMPLLLLIFTGAQYSIEPAFYTYSCVPFALVLILSLTVCQITRYSKAYDLKRLLRPLLLSGGLGIILVFLNFPTGNPIANFGIPILAIAGGIALFRMFQSSFQIEAFDRALRESSRAAMHAGLAIILLGAFVSSTMQIHENEGQTFEIPIGSSTVLEDTGLTLRVFGTDLPHYVSEFEFEMLVTVGIIDGSNVMLKVARLLADEDFPNANGEPMVHAFPAVFHGLWRDIYVSVVGFSDANTVHIRVTILTLVSFVWIGSVLLCIGIVPLLSYRGIRLLKPQAQPPT